MSAPDLDPLDPYTYLNSKEAQQLIRDFVRDHFRHYLGKGECKTCEGKRFVRVELLYSSVNEPCPDCSD